MTGNQLKVVAKVLKKHFTNLTTDRTIEIAEEILTAVDKVREEENYTRSMEKFSSG